MFRSAQKLNLFHVNKNNVFHIVYDWHDVLIDQDMKCIEIQSIKRKHPQSIHITLRFKPIVQPIKKE